MNKKKKEDSAEKKQKETKLKQSKRKEKKKKGSSRGSLHEAKRKLAKGSQQRKREKKKAASSPLPFDHLTNCMPCFCTALHMIMALWSPKKRGVFFFSFLDSSSWKRKPAEKTPFY